MANLEVLALDPTAPQIEAPQTGNGYSMPRLVNIAPEAVTGAAATPSVAVAQTWNTTGTPTALQVNVTDTASNVASKLLDLQVGGTGKFSVSKYGDLSQVQVNNAVIGSAYFNGTNYTALTADPTLIRLSGQLFEIGVIGGVSAGSNFGFSTRFSISNSTGVASIVNFYAAGQFTVGFGNNGIAFGSQASLGNPAADLFVIRDAANTLAQRNGVNAQRFNLYNTYTSGSVYERVSLYAASNVFYLGSDQTGATLRPLLVNHGATAYAALPAANTCEGARAYVTDSTVSTFGATVAGGGANKTVVWSNGTNWLVG